MKKYNIDDLHQDVNNIYLNYDRGDADEEITIKIALNICQTFIKDNLEKINVKMECPTCQGDGAIYEKRNLATRDK